LVLRQVGDDLEVVSNGVLLMDTRDGTSERLLVSAALAARPGAQRLLIGGLGVGFSLWEAVGARGLAEIDVVEIESDLVAWHHTHLRHITASALADDRVRVVVADLLDHLRQHPDGYDVVCLDVDNGPDWTVTSSNEELYRYEGLAAATAALRDDGVLAVWSASRSPGFEDRLAEHLSDVRALEVDVRLERAEPDVVYLGRRRR
jgi:spermidine synthase